MSNLTIIVACAALGSILTVGGYAFVARPACSVDDAGIINSGERILHVPGTRFYAEARITYTTTERWLCD